MNYQYYKFISSYIRKGTLFFLKAYLDHRLYFYTIFIKIKNIFKTIYKNLCILLLGIFYSLKTIKSIPTILFSNPYIKNEIKTLEMRTRSIRLYRNSHMIYPLMDELRVGLFWDLPLDNYPKLVHNYIDAVFDALDYLSKLDQKHFIHDFFLELIHIHGKSALVLSGGGSLATYHLGVIKNLYKNDCLPDIISGSSAGSIIAAFICTKPPELISSALNIENLDMNILEMPIKGNFLITRLFNMLKRKFIRLWTKQILFDSNVLKTWIINNIGMDLTFAEAYRISKKTLNITISSTNQYYGPFVLNHITAPDVAIWSAIVASCSIPFMFKKADLYYKTSNGTLKRIPYLTGWVDGSLQNDLPFKELTYSHKTAFKVVSQVNPHIVPIISIFYYGSYFLWPLIIVLKVVRSELLFRLPQLSKINTLHDFCKIFHGILTQSYMGDITILSYKYDIFSFIKAFSPLSKAMINNTITSGYDATSIYINEIKIKTKIERKLTKICTNITR